MSANNSTHFVGVIAREPDIKGKIARLSLAVRRSRTREGEPDADFVPLTLLGEKAVEFVQNYLQKGRWIAISAIYRSYSWESDGTTHYGHEFVVDQDGVSFVGPKVDSTDNGSSRGANAGGQSSGQGTRGASAGGRTGGYSGRGAQGGARGSSNTDRSGGNGDSDDDVPF